MKLHDSWKTGETGEQKTVSEGFDFPVEILKDKRRQWGNDGAEKQQSMENNPITLENIRLLLIRSVARLWQCT